MARDYNSSSSSSPPLPLHLCVFFSVLLILVVFSWYLSYEPVVEGILDQVKLVLLVSPLVLLLAVHWLSSTSENGGLSYVIPLPENKESLHGAAGTPWGVGFLLAFLFFVVSYQSQFQERWFPLLSR